MLKRKAAHGAAAPTSPSREALKKADAALNAAREKATAAQADINRLQGIIDAVGPAQQKLQAAIAKDGGKALARFSAGNRSEKIGELVNAADNASRAALAARDALPEAERLAAVAREGIARAEEQKRRCVRDVLVEQADEIGRRYIEGFAELTRLYGELVAIAEGARLPDMVLTTQQIEVPRFNLPCMSMKPKVETENGFSRHGLASDDGGYSPFLRYRPGRDHLNAQRTAWSRFAAALLSDVSAEFGGQDAGTLPEQPGLIRHVRERAPEPNINTILYGRQK